MSPSEDFIEAVKQGDLERVKAVLETDDKLASVCDESGATPLHYAALNGHRQVVRLLLEHGADIDSADARFGATPAGWAIEYLREMGAHLAIELDDLAYAIRAGDARWVSRFLTRFPELRHAKNTQGTSFRKLAWEAGNPEIAALFEMEEGPPRIGASGTPPNPAGNPGPG